jgi:hypothetical protein
MKFKIKLYGEYWYKAPQVKVNIDDNTMWEGKVHRHLMWSGIVNQNSPNNTRVIEFSKEIPEGNEVRLNIVLENKTDDQTVIENGKVMKDQLLHIKSIEIDDIDIESTIWEGEYTPIYGKTWYKEQLEAGITPPIMMKNITCLGANGTWTLKFKSPFYLWLLESTTRKDISW